MTVYSGDADFTTPSSGGGGGGGIGARRFFQGYPWRFLFTDTPSDVSVGGVTTTWAEGLLTNRSIVYTLDQPSVISASVWPDDRRVNQLFHLDGEPLVAQSNRLIYGFRREGGAIPWKCRAAGILMSPQDQGDADIPLSHIVAYDPWEYLKGRPFFTDGAGTTPDVSNGYTFFTKTGDEIIGIALKNAIDSEGFAFVDAGVAYGGTAFYGGTIETTDLIGYRVQRGSSVADVWDAMCNSGNCDIVLTPIYDPIFRPGYTHELNVYRLAGSPQRTAVFAWDKLNRSCTDIDRMHDGTPGSFYNKVQAYAGQGGYPIPPGGPLENTLSINRYLPYWLMQFNTTQDSIDDATASQVLAMATQELVLHKQGNRTMTLKPTSGRAPIPLLEYMPGDRVPIYATRRLRVIAEGLQRVQAFTISVADDGVEEVPTLLCSPDYRNAEGDTA